MANPVLESFIKAVDEVEPEAAVVTAVVQFFVDLGLDTPGKLGGVRDTDLGQLPAGVEARGLIRRTLAVAQAALQVRAMTSQAPPQPQQQGQQPGSSTLPYVSQSSSQALMDLTGGESSALVLAEALSKGQTGATPLKLMTDAGFADPFYGIIADANVFVLMSAEVALAMKENRQPWIYVDLTSKALLPQWLVPDAIGGKTVKEFPGASADAVSALGTALKAASQSPRFFRTFSQWLGAFNRFAPAAVSTKLMTSSQVLGYHNVMARAAEEVRAKTGNSYLAFLYDEVHRKSLADRVRCGEQVDFNDEFNKINKNDWDTAIARLDITLAQCGIAQSQESSACPDAFDSIMAKQAAGADALMKKAEAATRELAKQQDLINQRTAAARAASAAAGGGGKGTGAWGSEGQGTWPRQENWPTGADGKPMSKTKLRSQQWIATARAKKKGRR